MAKQIVVGAGAVGRATASALADDGHDVVVVSRRGSVTGDPRVQSAAVDASDPDDLTAIVDGAGALINCANPPYDKWAEVWPALAASLLQAAERTGAVLATMSNLYGYGPVDQPMRPSDPLKATFSNGAIRAAMWHDALAAHDAGRVRVTEARASDFIGPGTGGTSHLGRALPRILSGKSVQAFGSPDEPHSWTFVPDVGRALATLAVDERAWGRAWHVPSSSPLTQRQLFAEAARVAGVATPKVRGIPNVALRALGWFNGEIRALRDVSYQFEGPFIIDATETSEVFGLSATPIDEALAVTIATERDGVESKAL